MSSEFSVLTPSSPLKWKGTHNFTVIVRIALVVSATMLCFCQASNLHPIILVPGSGGNQLEARLTSEYRPSTFFCDRWYPFTKDEAGWFRLWFDPTIMFSPFTKCFAERMMLYYDHGVHDYRNAPGLQTRVPYFGSTKSLLYLNPHLKRVTAYMEPLVKKLEEIGYLDGENLFGAPYDFRYGLAAEGHSARVGSTYLENLKYLVENASAYNDNDKVIIIAHSLGGLFVQQMLSRNPIPWRKKFIKRLITLSVPWGGAVEQMRTFASGNTLGIPFANPLIVRDEQRSSESNLWLLPSPKVFNQGKMLVNTKNTSYSAFDIAKFLEDIGATTRVNLYKSRILPLVKDFVLPAKVKATCIIGSGVQTPESLFYGEAGFDVQPEIVYGDGDGTVNMVSLMALKMERDEKRREAVKVIKVGGVTHAGILKDEGALRNIVRVINDINSMDSSSSQ